MKAKTIRIRSNKPARKCIGEFASEAEFLAAKNRRFQEVFGKVDWDKARKDGLIH